MQPLPAKVDAAKEPPVLGPVPRRLRASFLLRCVILAVSVVLLAGATWGALALGLGWLALPAAGVLWFGVVRTTLLEEGIEGLLVRRALRRGRPVRSLWFVDLDDERDRARAGFLDETRDNPTVR